MFMNPANLNRIPSDTTPQPERMNPAASSEADQDQGAPHAGGDAQEQELADYLRRIDVPDLDADGPTSPHAPRLLGEDGDAPPPAPPIDREAFFVVFGSIFNTPQYFQKRFAPLAIQAEEKESARAASDSIYALLEIYYPQALQPGSDTLGYLLTAAPFLMAKAMVVRAIFVELRTERARPANRDQGPAQEKAETRPQERAPDPSRAFDFMDEERPAA